MLRSFREPHIPGLALSLTRHPSASSITHSISLNPPPPPSYRLSLFRPRRSAVCELKETSQSELTARVQLKWMRVPGWCRASFTLYPCAACCWLGLRALFVVSYASWQKAHSNSVLGSEGPGSGCISVNQIQFAHPSCCSGVFPFLPGFLSRCGCCWPRPSVFLLQASGGEGVGLCDVSEPLR